MKILEEQQFCIYKIYSENCLLYIGKTIVPLDEQIHEHVFRSSNHQPIHVDAVEKIEYTRLPTAADMTVYHCYLVNLLKPVLNREEKETDLLTVHLPEISFLPYSCSPMHKWSEEIHKREDAQEHICRLKAQLQEEKENQRRTIFETETLEQREKENMWNKWLAQVYEPLRNGLY